MTRVPRISASTVELSAWSASLISRASASACSPNDTMRETPARSAWRREAREMRIVAIDDRCAARHDAGKNLRLGVGNRFDRCEELQMHRLDGGDDRDVRAHELGQRRDLAGVIHADFEHRKARCRRQPRERQRHAPVIVERGDRRVGLAIARQRNPQRFLGRGLADGAGDGDDLASERARAARRDRLIPPARPGPPAAAHRPASRRA